MNEAVQVVALPMGEFIFAPGEPYAGQTGVVVAYAIRHPDGVFLFDTGFGFGNAEVDDYYQVRARRLPEVVAAAGLTLEEITQVANCHLHFDHSGQNSLFPRMPIYVQSAEWRVAHETEYTVLEWIDFPNADYQQRDGDYEPAPGLRIFLTPGHAPGHQSLVVDTPKGLILLAGQAVYSRGEWAGLADAREGATSARDRLAYDRSVAKLRALNPKHVLFGHDRRGWPD